MHSLIKSVRNCIRGLRFNSDCQICCWWNQYSRRKWTIWLKLTAKIQVEFQRILIRTYKNRFYKSSTLRIKHQQKMRKRNIFIKGIVNNFNTCADQITLHCSFSTNWLSFDLHSIIPNFLVNQIKCQDHEYRLSFCLHYIMCIPC